MMPKGKFVLKVTQPGIKAGRKLVVGKGRMRGHSLEKLAPGNQFHHPNSMLLFGRSGFFSREVLGFPRTESGTNLVPVVHGGAEFSQHARLEAADLAYFKRERCCV